MLPRIALGTTLLALTLALGACNSGDGYGYGGSYGGSGGDAGVGGSEGGSAAVEGASMFLQRNLHADENNRTYTTNYQFPTLIPMGTPVRIDSQNRKVVKFTRLDTNQQFTFLKTKHLRESYEETQAKYFGSEDPTPKIAELSEVDQQGISQGMALEGMTKEGVLYACGYPPDHKTPSLDSNQWRYWTTKMRTQLVFFDENGVVTRIQN